MKRGLTKSGGQKHALDKFYTNPDIAKKCIGLVDIDRYDVVIEPSAGNGSFSSQIENCIAFDIHPESSSIIKQDWLQYQAIRDGSKKTLVIGNPPFGQQNSVAVQFINHAAQFADTVAFILPRSFGKESVQRRLDPYLHLRKELVLPADSFSLDGELMDVPCVFQIWDYKPEKRLSTSELLYKGFSFVKKDENPDLFMQRIGGNAGKVGKNCVNRSISSNYFIKIDKNVVKIDEFVEIANKLVLPSRDLTVGPRSISKNEFVRELLKTSDKFHV